MPDSSSQPVNFTGLAPLLQDQSNLDEDEKFIWYILAPGSQDAEGPLSAREIDVKFRTNEISSHYHAWKQGMSEWKKIFEIDQLKSKLIESKSEVLEEVVQEYMKTLQSAGAAGAKKDKKAPGDLDYESENDEEEKEKEKNNMKDESDVCYYSKAEKKYKVYNPKDKTWRAQDVRPSSTELIEIKKQAEEIKAQEAEDKLVKQIHHDIVGSDNEEKLKSVSHVSMPLNDIASQAAMDVLQRVNSESNKEGGATASNGEQVQTEGEQNVKPMSIDEIKAKELKKLKKKRYLENKKKKWYQSRVNTYIYIKGLPNDINETELKDYFVRCGVIRLDPYTGQEQIRIYKDQEGVPKGDARIGYAMEESVDMAVEMLNDTEFRPGCKISVEVAEFQQKGQEYVPRKKQKVDKLEQLRIKAEQERQLAWDDDFHAMHQVGLHIVILEQIYTEQEVQANIDRIDFFFEELELELRSEIESQIGQIERIQFFKENPNGIVKIRFASSLSADECIKIMNGRFFDGRQISAHYWDGKTDYRIVRETETDFSKRVDDFGQWLEQEGQVEGGETEKEGEETQANEGELDGQAM